MTRILPASKNSMNSEPASRGISRMDQDLLEVVDEPRFLNFNQPGIEIVQLVDGIVNVILNPK
jgi:hypothetical protein